MPEKGLKVGFSGLAARQMKQEKTRGSFSASGGFKESKTARSEDDVAAEGETSDVLKAQMDDTLRKLADFEDRLRLNNLQELDVPEGVKGTDPCSFMVNLFTEAFLALSQWDWERDI
ncbi:hypothetical protein NDU88_007246 [Pleurodeles waltl]|uniref:Uncharacterized protein n=1 Tax=Pleurodeles waltl TaxID=8319 RepID=A0AAV7QKC2_PLEWA|nr:hypothetical protein NDU88_007246 [Pleurodeles waltl]